MKKGSGFARKGKVLSSTDRISQSSPLYFPVYPGYLNFHSSDLPPNKYHAVQSQFSKIPHHSRFLMLLLLSALPLETHLISLTFGYS